MINKIKEIEASAYPEHMQMLQECYSMEDIADYCECSVSQLHILQKDNFYVLVANHKKYVEVVDWASTRRCVEPFAVFKFIKNIAKGKTIKLDARKETSYPFIKEMEKRGLIKITHDESWSWGGDIMHEIEMCIMK